MNGYIVDAGFIWGHDYHLLSLTQNMIYARNIAEYDVNWYKNGFRADAKIIWKSNGEILAQENMLKLILILYGLKRTDLLPESLR